MTATVIGVDTFDDVVNPNDGVISLREAVLTANASPDDFEIQLPAGTYLLTINGANEDAALTGDLDIRLGTSLKIVGAGANTTTIDAASLFDRIFDVFSGAVLELDGLTLTGGSRPFLDGDPDGGAIRNRGGRVSINHSVIAQNTAEEGGAIYNANHGVVSLAHSVISDNASLDEGGAIYNADHSVVSISGTTVSKNRAGEEGGAIYNLNHGVVSITQTTISENMADREGGGIYNTTSGQITIADSTIVGNAARDDGGGVYNTAGGQVTIIDSAFSENSARDGGGGLLNEALGTVSITNSTFSKNNAAGGGALVNEGQATLIGTVLSDNTASASWGGAIVNWFGGHLTITDGKLTDNSAKLEGGAIFNDHNSTVVLASTWLSGHSAFQGGAISNRGTVTMTGSTLTGSSATLSAGGIRNLGMLTLIDSTVLENSPGGGGGISNSGQLEIVDSTLSDNSADFSGGGIQNSGRLTMTGSTLSRNSAKIDGGAILGFGGTGQIVIRHSTITGNRADADGNDDGIGGGLVIAGTALLDHTIVAGNERGQIGNETPSDIELETGGLLDAASSFNLIGDPNIAGGLVHGTNGNIVGDGSGNPLDINSVLNTTLADNGGPTLTHALVPGSPAINAGDPNFTPPPDHDQRGVPFVRVFGGRIDIGAFEVQVGTLVHAVEQLLAGGALNDGQANSLLAKLNFNGNLRANLNRLDAFINHTSALVRGGVLTQAEGQLLIDAAESLRDSLVLPTPSGPVVDAALALLADELVDGLLD